MTAVEIGGLITAILLALGTFIKTVVDSRAATKKSDLETLQASLATLQVSVELQHKADMAVIDMLRGEVAFQGGEIVALKTENNKLHDADNAMRMENHQLSIELEAVRQENRALRTKVDEQAVQITELQNENAVLRAKNAQLEKLTVDLGDKLDEYRSGRRPKTGSLGGAVNG